MEPSKIVSIIVPIYKVEAELPRCVDSLRAQTYPYIEIVLVDDGSPDRCGEICGEYAARDSRIRVIHKMNGGLSSARNAGLDAATGEYILYVDSDDTIEPELIEVCMQAIERTGAEAAQFGKVMVRDGVKSPDTHYTAPRLQPGIALPGRTVLLAFLDERISPNTMLRICRTGIARTVRFDEGFYKYEDHVYTYSILKKLQSIVWVPICGYNHIHRAGSLSDKTALGSKEIRMLLRMIDIIAADSSGDDGELCRAGMRYCARLAFYAMGFGGWRMDDEYVKRDIIASMRKHYGIRALPPVTAFAARRFALAAARRLSGGKKLAGT